TPVPRTSPPGGWPGASCAGRCCGGAPGGGDAMQADRGGRSVTEARGGVLVAGSINTDLVAHVRKAPEAGETVTGRSFAVFGGGKGANQAVASARSGATTAMLGAVGQDDFGRQRLADLAAEGIDTGSV